MFRFLAGPMLLVLVHSASLQAGDLTIGFTHTIQSTYLGKDRHIQVYVPESFKQDLKRVYPTVYILDRQQYFLNAVAYQQSFTHLQRAPEYIVVGIESDHPQRLESFSVNLDAYLGFVGEELIPFIEKTYPASGDRAVFGWQMATLFVYESLMKQPALFNAYFAASGGLGELKGDELKLLEGLPDGSKKYLYFTLAASETWALKSMDAFTASLVRYAPKSLEWVHERFEDEDHWSTPYRTLYRGLMNYYSDFPPIRFESVVEFDQAGGHEYLTKIYKARAAKYDESPEISWRTTLTLMRAAMNDDNFDRFHGFIEVFRGRLQDGWDHWDHWSRWMLWYANFYRKHQKPGEALKLLALVEEKLPNEAEILHGMGLCYQEMGRMDEAGDYFRKAVVFGEKQRHESLAEFKASLAALAQGKD